MPTDKQIISALSDTLATDPMNHTLRVHLATLLAADRLYSDAFDQILIVLANAPTDHGAIRLAADVSENLGDLKKAADYRTLLSALEGGPLSASTVGSDEDDWTGRLGDQAGESSVLLGGVGPEEDSGDGVFVDVERPDLRLSDVAGLRWSRGGWSSHSSPR